MRVRPALGLLLCAACAPRGAELPAPGSAPRPPNVILFLADDLGYGDLRSYNPAATSVTPNIDRLAREGLRFTDAHASASVCTPSRYGLLTGRYAWRTGLGGGVLDYFSEPLIEPGRATLASLLRDRGYATAAIGKWHLGLDVRKIGGGTVRPADRPPLPDFSAPVAGGPLDHGFDYYFGKAGGEVRAFIENRDFVGVPQPSGPLGDFAVAGWDEARSGRIEADKALAFIDRVVTEEPRKPFFLFYASHAPHVPLAIRDDADGAPVTEDEDGDPGLRAAGLREADDLVGLLLAKLDDLDLARDTLFILTSDNGPARRGGAARDDAAYDAAGGLRGLKGGVWEGGHRVPFIVRWAETVRPGQVEDGLIGLNDLLATLAELASGVLPDDAGEDSDSFRHLLLGQPCQDCGRRTLLHHSVAGVFAIREGPWKLVLGRGSGGFKQRDQRPADEGGQLYDLAADLAETTNLYDRQPEVVARLTAALERYRSLGHSARRLDRATDAR